MKNNNVAIKKNLDAMLVEATAEEELTKLAGDKATEDKEPKESAPKVDEKDVRETLDKAEDVKPVEVEDGSEEKKEEAPRVDFKEEVDGAKIPEGTEEKKPEESAPKVDEKDVRETLDKAEDVKPVEVEDGSEEKKEEAPRVDFDKKLDEALERLNRKIDELREDAEGVHLPEGTLTKKPEESSPEVKEDDVRETLDKAEDVKPVEVEDGSEEKKEEAPRVSITEDAEGVHLPEGTLTKKPEESSPEVKEDDVRETLDKAEDVKPVEVEDGSVETEKKDYKADGAAKTLCDVGVDALCDCKDYKSLKEAIKLGTARFEDDKSKKELQEHIAILLASDNHDKLFDEYNKTLSEAVALKEAIVRKYSIISANRTGTLLESMSAMEAKIAKEQGMFKKLHEQIEINDAKDAAAEKPLSVDETAFF
jgi:hypothetical protein